MAKKRHEPIKGMSERKATREYMQTLGEVYEKEGVLAAIGYEIKSTFYSLGRRIENLLDGASAAEHTRDLHMQGYAASGFKRSHQPPDYIIEHAAKESRYRNERIKFRKEDRHGYILRGKNKSTPLENAAAVTSIVLLLLGSTFFTFPGITGNVIGSLPAKTTNLLGATLFIIGLIGAFFILRKK